MIGKYVPKPSFYQCGHTSGDVLLFLPSLPTQQDYPLVPFSRGWLVWLIGRLGCRLLPQEEPEVSQILETVFKDEGITVVKGRMSKVAKDESTSGHIVTCTLSDKSTIIVSGDTLLLSLGRVPNVKNVGLEAVGIKLNEKNGIGVNANLQTSVKSVYAAGDCTGDRQL
jgi:pyruvate/2-oxoglutarate dehydrogenase complex dihydrolipoamide dehydrogenase (E3) component